MKEFGKLKYSRSLVFKWHMRFEDGRESVKRENRCCRPACVRPTMAQKVKDLVSFMIYRTIYSGHWANVKLQAMQFGFCV